MSAEELWEIFQGIAPYLLWIAAAAMCIIIVLWVTIEMAVSDKNRRGDWQPNDRYPVDYRVVQDALKTTCANAEMQRTGGSVDGRWATEDEYMRTLGVSRETAHEMTDFCGADPGPVTTKGRK